MKKIFTLILIMVSMAIRAQITVNNGDMSSTGDTLRVSKAAVSTSVDLTLTGPNYNWDFSTLVADTQLIDSFITLGNAGGNYALYFLLNPPTPNLAEHVSGIAALQGAPLVNPIRFYQKSANTFSIIGYGGNLSGTDIPLGFTNPDVVYNFPVNFGDQDSSDSDFSISVPGVGYAAGNQHRVNNVDGWGSLTTPFGTFDVLRIVSKTTGHDSIYDSSTLTGYSIDQPLTREYKWLGKNQGIPLLTITTQEVLSTEIITDIAYLDSIRNPVISGISHENDLKPLIELVENPSKGSTILKYYGLNSEKISIHIFDLTGKEILKRDESVKAGLNEYSLNLENARPGIYMVKVQQNGKALKSLRWVIAE